VYLQKRRPGYGAPLISSLMRCSISRDGASTSRWRLRPLITGQPSSVAIGSEKPTTPCKCCASITGRWWTGGRRRGTGTLAPKIHSSRSGLAENLVQGRRSNSAGSLDFSIIRSVSPHPMESGSPPACIWKENCSDQFISVDSKGSVAQCDCWVTSYPNYFFGNILREPGLTRISRQALRDATLSSDFLNGKRFSMCWLLVPFQSAGRRSAQRYGGYEWI